MNTTMERREFLKLTMMGTGLAISVGMGGLLKVATADDQGAAASNAFHCTAFIVITPDNAVTILSPKSELGQGTYSSLAMIVADEMDADWKQIRVEAAPAADEYKDPEFHMQITGGSRGITNFYDTFRKAAASAKAMLIQAAADGWKVPARECVASNGTVQHAKSGHSLTYGQLCVEAAKLPLPRNVSLKKDSEFRLIGTSVPRLDVPDKVKGAGMFGIDKSVPDMLIAVVARPPAMGAKLLSLKKEGSEKVSGVRNVVTIGSGVALVADTVDAAWKGRDALEIKWDKGTHPDLDTAYLERLLAQNLETKGAMARNVGDVEAAMKSASKTVKAKYDVPFLAHVTMEPMNCTAHVQKGRCDVWVPTQFQTAAQQVAMKETGLKADQVHVHTTYCGGGFGRRAEVKVVEDAVQISKAVGKPVKLMGTRDEDISTDFFRPGSIHRIEGALDGQGRLIAWSHKLATPSIVELWFPGMLKGGIDFTAVEGVVDMEYAIPNLRVEQVLVNTPLRVGFWRSVGHSSNAFMVESFVDELAHAAGTDPLAFRLNLLEGMPRSKRVLQTVAEAAGWGKPLPKGRGRGIALAPSYGSWVAHVAEVSVDSNGAIKVDRVVSAVDCGPYVHPDNVVAQLEGGIIMGLSAALKEKVQFGEGSVKSSNFDDYELLTMSECPKIEVHIVKSTDKRGGIGEVGVPPTAPAVANAVFNATGARLRQLPMTPDVVKQAMGK
jgi:isoquinoline 1-oxidoreductase beta subunit